MIIDDKMSSEKGDVIKEQPEDEMDTGISWAVLIVAFIGQAMSIGFFFCYGILYVEIVEAYGASERQAGKCLIIPLDPNSCSKLSLLLILDTLTPLHKIF